MSWVDFNPRNLLDNAWESAGQAADSASDALSSAGSAVTSYVDAHVETYRGVAQVAAREVAEFVEADEFAADMDRKADASFARAATSARAVGTHTVNAGSSVLTAGLRNIEAQAYVVAQPLEIAREVAETELQAVGGLLTSAAALADGRLEAPDSTARPLAESVDYNPRLTLDDAAGAYGEAVSHYGDAVTSTGQAVGARIDADVEAVRTVAQVGVSAGAGFIQADDAAAGMQRKAGASASRSAEANRRALSHVGSGVGSVASGVIEAHRGAAYVAAQPLELMREGTETQFQGLAWLFNNAAWLISNDD